MIQIGYKNSYGEDVLYDWQCTKDFDDDLTINRIEYIRADDKELVFLLRVMPFLGQIKGKAKRVFYGDVARDIYMNLCEMISKYGSIDNYIRDEIGYY